METIRVNMTPCEDIKTIHASQNDNEAREWGFELHNNGEKIDSSSISDQLVFKAYKGGTEQLLPENGSTPTTSPFLGDIKYPQGLLSDQEFTYRQNPTEEDGLAFVESIKGNTLNWNQLVENGNFADTSKWNKNGNETVFTVNNNEATILTNITGGGLYNNINGYVPNHKYLYSIELKGETSHALTIGLIPRTSITITTSWSKYIGIIEPTNQTNNFAIYDPRSSGRDNVYARNVQLIDLTKMGLDISSPSDFTSLFSLPYYAYNQGTLLSFNGNGIKTVGKNQFNVDDANADAYVTLEKSNGEIRVVYDGTNAQRYRGFYMYRAEPYVNGHFLPTQYTVSFDVSGIDTTWVFGIRSVSTNSFHSTMRATINSDGHYSFAFNPSELTEDYYLSASRTGNKTTAFDITFSNIQMEFGTETSYEPYTSSALSLPISTYFPNGMKSAGSAYDELTPSKAITRIGAVDLGTLNWSQRLIGTTPIGMQTNGLSATIKNPSTNNDIANIISTAGTASSWTIAMGGDSSSGLMAVSGGYLFIATTETNPTAFKSAMSGVYLYYELATPTETSFTTASLVTENAEIPLSNEDGVLIGKCTEELSAEPGFHDAKIKLSDADGECYSNKLQLHIERSPQ